MGTDKSPMWDSLHRDSSNVRVSVRNQAGQSFAKNIHMRLPGISSTEFVGLSRSEMPTEACLQSAARLIARLECAESRPYAICSDLQGGLEFVWSKSATKSDVTIVDWTGEIRERLF